MKKATETLRSVFGTPQDEAFYDTARVLTSPSTVTQEIALQSIEAVNWADTLRDLGNIAAQKIANDLEGIALRPADYAYLPNLPEMVAKQIASALEKVPTEFVQALVEQLKLRG